MLHIYYFDNRCPYYVALVFSRCEQCTTAYLAVLIIGVIANIWAKRWSTQLGCRSLGACHYQPQPLHLCRTPSVAHWQLPAPLMSRGGFAPHFGQSLDPPGCRKRNRSRKGPRGLSEKEGIGYNAETVAIMLTPEPPPYTHASLYVAGILADGAFVWIFISHWCATLLKRWWKQGEEDEVAKHSRTGLHIYISLRSPSFSLAIIVKGASNLTRRLVKCTRLFVKCKCFW